MQQHLNLRVRTITIVRVIESVYHNRVERMSCHLRLYMTLTITANLITNFWISHTGLRGHLQDSDVQQDT